MKRFHFQLDKLLRYHQQRQKQAELLLVRASHEIEAARAAVFTLEQQIEAACRLPERVGRPIEPALREQSLRHAQHLAESLRPAADRLKQAEQRYREAQGELVSITKQVESLLLLRSQRWQEHVDEATRQQQVELDDAVMKQWSRRATLAAAESDREIETTPEYTAR